MAQKPVQGHGQALISLGFLHGFTQPVRPSWLRYRRLFSLEGLSTAPSRSASLWHGWTCGAK